MSAEQSFHAVEAHVHNALNTHACSKVWVGFSGGVDSTALLLACHRVITQQHQGLDLQAIHVNHGLQDVAAGWVAHCAAVCAELGVDFIDVAVSVDPRGNVEANARAARYECFAQHLEADALLLLGHHEHDQTETVLYRLFQGRGLLPMRSQGPLGAGHFARPLLSLDRDALVAYVEACGVAWIEDDSNADVRLTRNFLRHDIIPSLSARWHSLHRSIRRVAAHQAETSAALHHALAGLADTVAVKELPPPGPVRQIWLRAYLQTRGVFSVSDKALREFDLQLSQGGHGQLDCGTAVLHSYAGQLYFETNVAIDADGVRLLEPGNDMELALGYLSLQPAQPETRLAFKYAGPLEVRFRVGGEQLRTAPNARTQSLKRLLSDAQIPPWRRAYYPLLYRNGELLCVPGLALNADAVHEQASAVHCTARNTADQGEYYLAVWQWRVPQRGTK